MLGWKTVRASDLHESETWDLPLDVSEDVLDVVNLLVGRMLLTIRPAELDYRKWVMCFNTKCESI